MNEWGKTQTPYIAYYGRVAATDVATWWNNYYPHIFAPNIRMFLGETDVNENLLETLSSEPEKFWYFNNGITALSSSIDKKPIGGNSRENGYFECQGFRIVNGAQTAGAVASACSRFPEKVGNAYVPIRIISLENTPEDFERGVTRYNNTQNRIDRRDFVALDPEQERIKTELQLEEVNYAYKSGDTTSDSTKSFDLVEATIARACFQPDSVLAVLAKGAIGRLWDDIDTAPYKILFNPGVSGPDIWKIVQLQRLIESSLVNIQKEAEGRSRLLAVHGNRFITHLVFQKLSSEVKDETTQL